ncbi:MAG: ABC transporter permease [DPANN group archaeon]|nr:ABC transporter permease [DPANN group archaeon]
MSELSGLLAIWEREFRVFLREKSRIFASLLSPLMWLFIFGGGVGSALSTSSFNYQTFIYPGIIVMSCLFTSIFYGAYVIWDKRLDFLKEVIVSPLSRTTIFFGKALGGVTDAIIQASVLVVLGPVFGVHYGWFLIPLYAVLFIMITGLVSIGLIIGSLMESPEGFGLITSLINFPLFFLSGALFPLDNLPSWLKGITLMNPVTYGVDAVRSLMLGTSTFGLFKDVLVLVAFAVIIVVIGAWTFSKMKV